jgi:hypothetical protein
MSGLTRFLQQETSYQQVISRLSLLLIASSAVRACSPGEPELITKQNSSITTQTLGEAQYMGRWSNIDTSVLGTGQGYRALGLSRGDPDHLFWVSIPWRASGAMGAGPPTLLGNEAHT